MGEIYDIDVIARQICQGLLGKILQNQNSKLPEMNENRR
jgi:hypothetical protein